MSKLYCKISESARRTIPTARAHHRATVDVMNFKYRISATLISNGGGDADTVVITITNLTTGWSEPIENENLGELFKKLTHAPNP